MQYRKLGNTGVSISEISLGCEHLDGKDFAAVDATIKAALDGGINAMDIFMPGREIRQNIAKALGSRRQDVFIQGHIGSTDVNQQYDISRDMPSVRKYFEDMLRIFGYIDFGMLFFVDGDKNFESVFGGEFVEYALQLKQKGDIRHIGFSSHNPATAIKAIQTGIPDMMMFSINPAFDMLPVTEYALGHLEQEKLSGELFRGIDPQRTELYNLCQSKGVGITVMKSMAGGKLISAEHTPFEQPMSVQQCIHYALSRPAVAAVMLGCASPDQVQHALKYYDMDEAEKDYTGILNTVRNDFAGRCVYCNHCQPCPVDIDIATVHKYLDMAALQPDPASLRSHYADLEQRGGDCINCGSCEERCPFGVPIMENMAKAEQLLGGANE